MRLTLIYNKLRMSLRKSMTMKKCVTVKELEQQSLARTRNSCSKLVVKPRRRTESEKLLVECVEIEWYLSKVRNYLSSVEIEWYFASSEM